MTVDNNNINLATVVGEIEVPLRSSDDDQDAESGISSVTLPLSNNPLCPQAGQLQPFLERVEEEQKQQPVLNVLDDDDDHHSRPARQEDLGLLENRIQAKLKDRHMSTTPQSKDERHSSHSPSSSSSSAAAASLPPPAATSKMRDVTEEEVEKALKKKVPTVHECKKQEVRASDAMSDTATRPPASQRQDEDDASGAATVATPPTAAAATMATATGLADGHDSGRPLVQDNIQPTHAPRAPSSSITDSIMDNIQPTLAPRAPSSSSITTSAPGAYASDGRGSFDLRPNVPRDLISDFGLSHAEQQEQEQHDVASDEDHWPAASCRNRKSHSDAFRQDRHQEEGLIEANPVSEEEENRRMHPFQQAQQHREGDKVSARRDNMRGMKSLALLVALIGLLVGIAMMIIVMSKSKAFQGPAMMPSNSSSNDPSLKPSSAPSVAWLLDFPQTTTETL